MCKKVSVFVALRHVSPHLDAQVYLPFGVCLGVDLADAALEEVAPTHVHEDGELLIVGAGDIAEEYVLFGLLVKVDYLHGIGVVAVVEFAHEAEWGARFEMFPHFISFVVEDSSEVAIHEILLVGFHNFSLTIND